MLKSLSLALLTSTLLAPAACAGSGLPWLTDYEMALKVAKKYDKVILADFTGSDWCSWCIKLKNEVFKKREFQVWAKKNAVLLELDFPRGKKLDKRLSKQNQSLAERFKIRGYPTIVFIDQDGDEIGRTGYVAGGPTPWLSKAKTILKAKPIPKSASKYGAANSTPPEKAESKWLISYSSALKKSKETGRPILADFTGSDWCSWCIKLKKEVFNTKDFVTWADENVVLLQLDYPNATPQPKAVAEQNKKLARKYSIEGYPTILFLNSKGKKIGKMGYLPGGPAPWIEKAATIVTPTKNKDV